jgi:undecaprenyl-diphosphatase
MTALDNAAYAFAASHQAPVFWTAVTLFGGVLGLGIATLIALYAFKGRRNAIMLTLALLASILVSQGLKIIFARPRPEDATLLTYAFPSGHTFGSTAVYGMISFLLWQKGLRWQALAIVIVPVMVGISRVMLLEHWLTDVIAGWILGALLVVIIVFFIRAGTSRAQQQSAR